MSPGRCELLFLDEAVSRLMKPETAYLIGLAPVACCSTVSNSYICSICSAVRASAVHEARRTSSSSESNGPSGGQIMLIAIMLALWRMYR